FLSFDLFIDRRGRRCPTVQYGISRDQELASRGHRRKEGAGEIQRGDVFLLCVCSFEAPFEFAHHPDLKIDIVFYVPVHLGSHRRLPFCACTPGEGEQSRNQDNHPDQPTSERESVCVQKGCRSLRSACHRQATSGGRSSP